MNNKRPDRLYRSADQRMFGGVAGGLGEYFNIDPVLVRFVFILLALITKVYPIIILYILLLFVVPNENRASSGKNQVEDVVTDIQEGVQKISRDLERGDRWFRDRKNAVGLVVLILGILVMANQFSKDSGSNFQLLWAVLLIALGVYVMFREDK